MKYIGKNSLNYDCVICGKHFIRTVTQAWNDKKTCSSRCRYKLSRKRKSNPDFNCVICGKHFIRSSGQVSQNKRTCSSKCRYKLLSESKGGRGLFKCEMCREEKMVISYWIKNGKRFCGNECRLKWFIKNFTRSGKDNCYWKGGYGIYYYGENWRKVRQEVRERDNNTCQKCKKTKEQLGYNLIVHHKIPFKFFGLENYIIANRKSNLICYCRSCHLKSEWKEQPRLRTNKNKKNKTQI